MTQAKHTKQMKAAARSTPEEDPEFQIAPMIDILLVLLIFFMSISSSEVLQTNQSVILPTAKDAKPPDKNAKGQAIINLLWNQMNNAGTIEVDKTTFNAPAQLTPMLAEHVKANPAMRVLIRADRNVRYEYLRAVMIAAANAGVGNVTFSVVDKDMPQKAAP
ncbi:MAG: biopolymer transport protein ExbD [Chthoniobacter sp.]|jgi:biopolymer transport protein ExbD|nr:biopolymer transport protein ExbD [Chthoniobacter sp.]